MISAFFLVDRASLKINIQRKSVAPLTLINLVSPGVTTHDNTFSCAKVLQTHNSRGNSVSITFEVYTQYVCGAC